MNKKKKRSKEKSIGALGNDVVLIVFKEGNTPFNPSCIRSHFNHVFVIVQLVAIEPEVQYRVAYVAKKGVKPSLPELPDPPIFYNDLHLRDFVLTKIVNSERAAISAPGFEGLRTRQKECLAQLRSDIIAEKLPLSQSSPRVKHSRKDWRANQK